MPRQQSATNAYYVSRYVQSNNKNNGNNYSPFPAYANLKTYASKNMDNEKVSYDEVCEAYLECRRTKRHTEAALEYEQQHELNNLQLWQELNTGTYEIGASIGFCVTRPKVREVFAASFRDRIVHHIVMRKFLHIFEAEMIDSSYNCRKGKGVIYGVKDVQTKIRRITHDGKREAWCLCCDIQGFFMAIDTKIAFRIVEQTIRENYDGEDMQWWIELFRKLIFHRPTENYEWHGEEKLRETLPESKRISGENGLTIGNYPNQIIANLYMTVFDRWLLPRLSIDEDYARFVDDFRVFSTDKQRLLDILRDSRTFLRDHLHLTLHPNKIQLGKVSQGVRFCGYVIRHDRIYAGKHLVGNIHDTMRRYDEDKDVDRLIRSWNSYMGFLSHANTYNIRKALWEKLDAKDEVVNINNRKIKKLTKNERLFYQRNIGTDKV